MIFGFCAGALGYALKSKCSRVKCCCFEIVRDVELEAEIEEANNNRIIDNILPPFTNESPHPSRSITRRSSLIEDAVKQAIKNVNEHTIEEELNKRSVTSSMSNAV